MLLLHQQNTARALAQFRDHMRLLKGVPMKDAPGGFLGSHWGWIARQYAVMADLLSKRVPPEGGLPPEVGARSPQLLVVQSLENHTQGRVYMLYVSYRLQVGLVLLVSTSLRIW